MSKRIALLRVDVNCLRTALGIPADTEISDCWMAYSVDGVLILKIEHPSLGLIDEGCLMPNVTAVFGPEGFIKFA